MDFQIISKLQLKGYSCKTTADLRRKNKEFENFAAKIASYPLYTRHFVNIFNKRAIFEKKNTLYKYIYEDNIMGDETFKIGTTTFFKGDVKHYQPISDNGKTKWHITLNDNTSFFFRR